MGLGKSICQKHALHSTTMYTETLNAFPFMHWNELNGRRKKKKEVYLWPYSFPVAFIWNLCNLQVKRLVQLLSATTVAVRVHQKTSSCSLISRSWATIQTLAAAVSWLLLVMDETTERSLLFHSYINAILPCWQARWTWFCQQARQIWSWRHKGSRAVTRCNPQRVTFLAVTAF